VAIKQNLEARRLNTTHDCVCLDPGGENIVDANSGVWDFVPGISFFVFTEATCQWDTGGGDMGREGSSRVPPTRQSQRGHLPVGHGGRRHGKGGLVEFAARTLIAPRPSAWGLGGRIWSARFSEERYVANAHARLCTTNLCKTRNAVQKQFRPVAVY
jgi:hypothetical protein